jgi:hypothetical protein
MRSMRVVRWILVALSIALATVLILRGNVIVGGLIGALAVTRGVMTVQMQRRRERFRQAIAHRRPQ